MHNRCRLEEAATGASSLPLKNLNTHTRIYKFDSVSSVTDAASASSTASHPRLIRRSRSSRSAPSLSPLSLSLSMSLWRCLCAVFVEAALTSLRLTVRTETRGHHNYTRTCVMNRRYDKGMCHASLIQHHTPVRACRCAPALRQAHDTQKKLQLPKIHTNFNYTVNTAASIPNTRGLAAGKHLVETAGVACLGLLVAYPRRI